MAGLLGGYSFDPLQMDPNLIAIQRSASSGAQDFSQNLPGYQNLMYNQAQNQSKNDLQNQMQDIKYGANKRGLLYSGLRQGAEASAQGQAANQLAGQRGNINYQTQNQSNQMVSQAAGMGLGIQEAQTQMNRQNYLNQLENYKQQMSGVESLGSGIGGLIGKFVGAKV